MDVLFFLKERTRLIRQYYVHATSPFNEIIRKIEAGAYFGRCWTLISVSLGQRERREMDTQFGTRGHAQCAASSRA